VRSAIDPYRPIVVTTIPEVEQCLLRMRIGRTNVLVNRVLPRCPCGSARGSSEYIATYTEITKQWPGPNSICDVLINAIDSCFLHAHILSSTYPVAIVKLYRSYIVLIHPAETLNAYCSDHYAASLFSAQFVVADS